MDKRVARRVPLVIRVEAHAGASPHIVLAQNISAGGMLLRVADPMPEGTRVRLHFTLPGSERDIRLTGTVQHVTPGEFMGIRFLESDAADLEAVRQFVEKA